MVAKEMDGDPATRDGTGSTEIQKDDVNQIPKANATTIFVGNLPFETIDEQLEKEFSEIGPIKRAFIVKDRDKKSKSRGCGYVQFVLQEDAEKCIELDKTIGNRKLRLSFANKKPKHQKRKALAAQREEANQNGEIAMEDGGTEKIKDIDKDKKSPKTIKSAESTNVKMPSQDGKTDLQKTIVLTGLTAKVKRKAFRILCEEFGEIENIVYPVPERDEVTAFIRFKDYKSAIRATQKIPGRKVRKSKILSTCLLTKENKHPSKKMLQRSRLIVRNLSFKCEENDLNEVFSKFGKVINVNIPTKQVNGKDVKIGCGFVQFANTENAKAALEEMNLKEIKERQVVLDWAITKEVYKEKLSEENKKADNAKGEESKEKSSKKKKKVDGITGVSEEGKEVLKKKKKKAKDVQDNLTQRGSKNEEELDEKPKKKKKKAKDAQDNSAQCDPNEEENEENPKKKNKKAKDAQNNSAQCDPKEEENEENPKKKKKKAKDAQDNSTQYSPEDEGTEEKPKKKKKKAKDVQDNSAQCGPTEENEENPKKKKKKVKVIDDMTVEAENKPIENEASKKKKKKKKREKVDEDLSTGVDVEQEDATEENESHANLGEVKQGDDQNKRKKKKNKEKERKINLFEEDEVEDFSAEDLESDGDDNSESMLVDDDNSEVLDSEDDDNDDDDYNDDNSDDDDDSDDDGDDVMDGDDDNNGEISDMENSDISGDDDDDSAGDEGNAKDIDTKPKREMKDAKEGKTVFIRNLSYDVDEEMLTEEFEKFGKINYCKLVYDHESGRSKGTAFLKFKLKKSADECMAEFEKKEKSGVNTLIDGRPIMVSLAVTKGKLGEIQRIKSEGKKETDKRNLYLAAEGIITRNSPAAEGLSDADMKKREKALAEKNAKLKNPNFFVSRTRLCVKNLPLATDADALRVAFLKHAPRKMKIKELKIMRSKDRRDISGMPRSLGFGFIELESHEDALALLRATNNNPDVFGEKRRPFVEFSVENAKALKILELKKKRIEMKVNNISENNEEGSQAKLGGKAWRDKIYEKRKKRYARYKRKKEEKKLLRDNENVETRANGERTLRKTQPKKKGTLNKNKEINTKNKKHVVQTENRGFKRKLPSDLESPEKRQRKLGKKKDKTEEEKFSLMVKQYKQKLFGDLSQAGKKKDSNRWFE